ncbi:MAG: 2-amino-4-hydroxy-6-hydroxymethyldihydropteridine diphosphokinase [Candidatus Wildermuthbacteria bacterium]|nr:2-amino-4-hydroxy-6-hydroxymethyldihydropteridine diphosphokinase [Candidatus Wildermuthbacteria bacterium]
MAIEIYIGLGSNMGDRKKNLSDALDFMQEKCSIERVSSLYETEPVGYEDQAWFLNCVAMAKTQLSPLELLLFLQSLEARLGRVRTVRNGPRPIDLDILLYGQDVLCMSGLLVPHPGMHERRFVLQPLTEITPECLHPVLGKTVQELLEQIGKDKSVQMVPGVFFVKKQ